MINLFGDTDTPDETITLGDMNSNRYYLSATGFIIDSQDSYCPCWARIRQLDNWREIGNSICEELNAGQDRMTVHKRYRDSLEKEF